ncbi:uncharacterized protein A1O5_08654 [Cladophialophora psammophila CBS 110553]|uniref:Uncharacterized protein n=1 Tax=Cladophialophora psammophila CBS 110553 TaxID=1182543 RepID=W9XC80_9EURO|nr:uncharacterized protein A1O5_08654 [Cladophialophora psammophila CBS 110553]EXJ68039.1 hypothetical protein A1O5_08654 [Cladophialophora psammophila CBS 110553]
MGRGRMKWFPVQGIGFFYVGTIPFFSLLYTVSHLAAFQFNGLPSPPYPYYNSRGGASSPKSASPQHYDANYTVTTTFFILCVSILHTLMWFAQCVLCTSCELAPILAGHQGRVPKWCPQSRFRDTGKPGLADMLGTLATVKDFLQWAMFVLAAGLIECARREWMRAEHVRGQQVRMMGAGIDFGGPGQAVGDVDFSRRPGGAGAAVELSTISGPRLVFRAEEEEAARMREEEETRRKRLREEEERKKLWAGGNGPLPRQPTGPGAPGNKDNYYGNGLKRSGTLNHMYESRV